MKNTIFISLILMGLIVHVDGQGCPTCGSFGSSGTKGDDTGPNFSISMGNAQYGESAGDLIFGNGLPAASLYTPTALQYDFPSRTDVIVVTNSVGSIRQ